MSVAPAPLVSPRLSDDEALATAALFQVLADPARVRIVNLLATRDQPACICHLVDELGLAQATVSHHARKLVDAGHRLEGVQAFDLFPNTPHVETVAVFSGSD